MMAKLSAFICFVAAIFLLLTTACTPSVPARSAQLVERKSATMGSELQISAWTTDEAAALSTFELIFQEVEKLDDLMSTWRDGSDVLRLNAAAGVQPVRVSEDVRNALRTARQVSDWTQGKFDVTFGVLSGLWKFDYQDKDNTIPDRREVEGRLSLINYRDLETDEAAGTAFLKRQGMRVNLGGIGKGYAVDRAAEILRTRGFRDFLIQFGGDIYAAGRRGDRPWRLGIRDPRGAADQSFATLDVSDSTFSTSGDYERFFMKDGRRYHHIIDPQIGEPSQGCRSVTIVTDRAVIADGLSTGVLLMGPEAGMALIERLSGVEGVLVSTKNEVMVSSGLKDRLKLVAPPTDAP